jgi:hypothetical protein
MSHVTLSKARILEADLSAVEQACKLLGLVFVRNVTQFKWYGRWMDDFSADNAAHRQGLSPEKYGQCDHVIRLPWTEQQAIAYARNPDSRPYEIGLVKRLDGSYALAMDTWSAGEGVGKLLSLAGGAECHKLMQTVSQCKVAQQVLKQPGHYIKRVDELANGTKKIVIGVKQTDRV